MIGGRDETFVDHADVQKFRELECDESVVEESVVGVCVELEAASVHGAEDGDDGVGGFDGS